MTNETFNEILNAFKALKNIRTKYENDWKEIQRWISPRGASFDTDTAPADRTLMDQNKLYDKTIKVYSETFARGLKSYTCSSQSPFFGLEPIDPEYAEDENIRYILQQRTSQMRQMLASTRFYKTTRTFFRNFGDFGIAAMLLGYEPEQHRFIFRTLAVGDCFMMRDHATDDIDVLFHVTWLTRSEAIALYGEDKLSETIRNEKDFTKPYQFIELYCRREAFGLNKEEGFPGTEWLEMAWENGQSQPCYQSGTDDRRFVAVSFNEAPDGDAYGTDYPGETLANTSKNMQLMLRDQLNASQLMTNPPLKKTKGLVADIRPGKFIDIPAGQDIAPLQLVQDVSWTNELRAEMRAIAKQVYYVDFFLMLSQYQGNVNTATLAQGLQNEQVMMMSDFLDSLLDEFFSPIVLWVYGVMEDEGLFTGDAAGRIGAEVRIKMVSTLYRLLQQQELQPTQQAMSMMLPFMQMDPENLLPYIDFQEYFEFVRNKSNADMKIIRSREDVEEIQAASAQAKAAALKKEQDIAQQDADTKTFAAMANAAGAETAPQQGQQAGQENNPFAGLTLRR